MKLPESIRKSIFNLDCLICVVVFCPFWGAATDGRRWHTISARCGSDKKDTAFARWTSPLLKQDHYLNAAIDEGLATR